MIDLMIYETGSGGELQSNDGYIKTVEGLTNQVYLALFGGNIEGEWWGNSLQNEENKFVSTFENELRNVSLNSSGIAALENSAKKDLEFLKKYADIKIIGSIPGLAKFKLEVELTQPNDISEKIIFIWDGTKNELIETITI
jgi:phage gp46-like protein